jgi:hypothetical protein
MTFSPSVFFFIFLFNAVLLKVIIHAEVCEETENGIIFRDPLKGTSSGMFVLEIELCVCPGNLYQFSDYRLVVSSKYLTICMVQPCYICYYHQDLHWRAFYPTEGCLTNPSTTYKYYKNCGRSESLHSVAGRRLENNLLRTVSVFSIVECGLECLRERCCLSVNYGEDLNNMDEHDCELNEGKVSTNPEDFTRNSSYAYYEIMDTGNGFRAKPCSEGKIFSSCCGLKVQCICKL